MFGREIGDAVILHGFIAITLYVRTQHVQGSAVTVHEAVLDRVHSGVSTLPLSVFPVVVVAQPTHHPRLCPHHLTLIPAPCGPVGCLGQ